MLRLTEIKIYEVDWEEGSLWFDAEPEVSVVYATTLLLNVIVFSVPNPEYVVLPYHNITALVNFG